MFVTKELFDETVGVLIKKCQCIEHDIKIMYAGMLRGDFIKYLIPLSINRSALY